MKEGTPLKLRGGRRGEVFGGRIRGAHENGRGPGRAGRSRFGRRRLRFFGVPGVKLLWRRRMGGRLKSMVYVVQKIKACVFLYC